MYPMSIEVEEKQVAVLFMLQLVYQLVQFSVAGILRLLDPGTVIFLVVLDKFGAAAFVSNMLSSHVEGDLEHPGVETAFAAEAGPRLPEGADDFLVEVAEILLVAVAEV